MADLSTVSNILKEYYLGPVQEQLNNDVLLLQRLTASSEDLVGKAAFVPLHTGRNGGVGAVNENAQLPAAGSQKYNRAEYDLKYLYGRIQVSGPSMAKTKSDAGSFLQILRGELDGVRNDLQKDLARQVYGKGDGVLADSLATSGGLDPATAVTAGGTLTVKLASWEVIKKAQIFTGESVDLYKLVPSTGVSTFLATGTIGVITTAAAATSTVAITVEGATSIAATTAADLTVYITRKGSAAVSPARYATSTRSSEIDGLARIINASVSTASTGISATTSNFVGKIDGYNTFWDNGRLSTGTVGTPGPITLQILQKAFNSSRTQAGNPTLGIMSLGVLRSLYSLLTVTQQFVSNTGTMDFKAGFQTITYNNVPMVGDIDAPYGQIQLLDESTLKVFSDEDWHFLDADGQTIRQVSNYDQFEAIMVRYMNIGANNRAKNTVITDVGVDTSGATADYGV